MHPRNNHHPSDAAIAKAFWSKTESLPPGTTVAKLLGWIKGMAREIDYAKHQALTAAIAEGWAVVMPATDAREQRQELVGTWCLAAFGPDQAASVPQRGLRLAEEAIEAAQAAGCEREMLHRLVDHIFDRPAGELGQELGGVGVTLLALARAAQLSAERCEVVEIERVLAKPLEHFTARNEAKNAAGFLAAQSAAN